ncbi:hypothetical protein EsH8_II_000296 [Colletotrichum jinshuiense]
MASALRNSAQFHNLMEDVADSQSGFIIVRTAYDPDPATDASRWSAALTTLRAYAKPVESEYHQMDELAILVMEDRESLNGASYNTVRSTFNAWVDDYRRRKATEEDEDGWGSDIRRDCCLVVDDSAFLSLSAAPHLESVSKQRRLLVDGEPWVVVVDAEDPANIDYNGGAPYLGWMRTHVRALKDLNDDLEGLPMSKGLCPRREYDGQISLYNGGRGHLIDPPGGIESRYKFPRGTPRGREGARAMLAEIRAALGEAAVAHIVIKDGP